MVGTRRPPRRWFRFSLRTLFVVVTVLGVGLGWLGVQLKWIHDRHEAIKWLENQPCASTIGGFYVEPAPCSIRLLGEEGIQGMSICVTTDEDATKAKQINELFPESGVSVHFLEGPSSVRK